MSDNEQDSQKVKESEDEAETQKSQEDDENSNNEEEDPDVENENDKETEEEEEENEEAEHEKPSKKSPNQQKKSSSKQKRAPSSKAMKSHPNKISIVFDSQMSIEQCELNLFKLFGASYPEATVEELIVFDKLSVKELRVIVRVLKICDASQLNVRKPMLCEYLQNYMKTDDMMEKYERYNEEKETNKVSRQKSKNEKNKSPYKKDNKNTSFSQRSISDTGLDLVSKKSENNDKNDRDDKPNLNSKVNSPRSSKEKNKSDSASPMKFKTRDTIEVVIPKLKFDSTFDVKKALHTLESCNKFVNQVSDRLYEIERALSILTFKVSELEKYYGCV